MAYTITMNPLPLGKLIVATPGTPIRLTSALSQSPKAPAGNADIMEDLWCDKLQLKTLQTSSGAHSANSGLIYIGRQDMNKTTLAGVYMILEPGESQWFSSTAGGNILRVGDYWVDADNANNWVTGWAHVS